LETQSYAQIREKFINEILDFFPSQDLIALNDIRQALEHLVDSAGPQALATLGRQLEADHGWGYYPGHLLARQIHDLITARFLKEGSTVSGAEHLEKIKNMPAVLLANHLSYADANVIEFMLRRTGDGLLADRLTVIAGPKVFTSRQRRFSSLCFGTIKVPQSAEVSSEEAVMNQREVALAARRSIEAARRRLEAGDVLLLFGEGTRSRTGGMQPMLAGVARYIEVPEVWVLPVGLTGSEVLYPVGDNKVNPACIRMYVGRPMPAGALMARSGGDRRIMMDVIGLAIAGLLPETYRGVYGKEDDFPEAKVVLRDLMENNI